MRSEPRRMDGLDVLGQVVLRLTQTVVFGVVPAIVLIFWFTLPPCP